MKTLVVEDSRLAREGLLRMLEEHADIDIVGSADCVERALEIIQETQPELLFLDIHMPGETGLQLLASISYQPKVIFTTAYSDYAIDAFEYNTIDYLLKPISKERLSNAIKKLNINTQLNADQSIKIESQETPLAETSRIFIKNEDECHLIDIQSIDYIESCKNYIRIYFSNKKVFVKKSLNQTEMRLPKSIFFRINRQYIVNIKAIAKITEAISEGYEITMRDGKNLSMSRRNSLMLKELMSL